MFETTAYKPAYRVLPQWRDYLAPLALVLLFVVGVAVAVLFHNDDAVRSTVQQHSAQLTAATQRDEEITRRLEAAEEQNQILKAELAATGEKIGMTERDLARARDIAVAAQRQAAARFGQVRKQVTTLRAETGARLGRLNTQLTAARADLTSTQRNLDQTRTVLTSAVGDITNHQTLIARNHDELMELKRRSERNYVEFDLPKSRDPVRVGDIALKLKKADPKHGRYNMEVLADDRSVEKKDRNVYEPVQFYRAGSKALYEVVVNNISKNRVQGYLSTPR